MLRRITLNTNRTAPGQALLLSTVLLAVVMGLVGAFVSYLGSVNRATETFSGRAAARQAALAGIEKVVWCLNQGDGTDCGGTYGGNHTGETDVAVGPDTRFSTSVTTVSGNRKTVTAVGEALDGTEVGATVTLKADVTVTSVDASFFYGVQSGNGGFTFEENAAVTGNIYSNGDVLGANGATVSGDVWVAGGTQLTADQQQQVNTEDYDFGRTNPATDIAQSFEITEDNVVNKISLYIKKAGTPSDKTVYIVTDDSGQPSDSVLGSATLDSSQVTGTFGWVDVVFDDPPALLDGVTYWFVVDSSNQSSRYYTIGSLTNNGYGNGIGMYSPNWNAQTPSWSDAGRDFAFQVYLGGVTTSLTDVEVAGDAHANTIDGATVGGDAYYQTIVNSTVTGAEFPGSDDPPPEPLPISDSVINQWKAEAEAGGTILGDVTHDGTSEALGPVRITGNLTVTNGAALEVDGTIYVDGSITLDNNVTISLDSGFGSGSGVILADGPIDIRNNVTFNGSGDPDSFVLVLSNDTSLDPDNPAMNIDNNSDNSIFYAADGVVNVANNASMKEVTGFTIYLRQNATVQYDSGLANINFSSGPGGSWVMDEGSLRELR